MLSLTDAELAALLQSGESDRLEFKSQLTRDSSDAIRKTVCAFANDLAGRGKPGIVVLGVDDQGKPTGLAITEDVLRSLTELRTEGAIVPPPTITVAKQDLGGVAVAVVTVAPSVNTPVQYRGVVYVRVGPTTRIANRSEEQTLAERRRSRDLPFDIRPIPGHSLEDLDLLSFERDYLPRAVSPEMLEANDRSIIERLAALKMIQSVDSPVPTALAFLLFGKALQDVLPGAFIQFLRISGPDEAYLDAAEFIGAVDSQIRAAETKLAAYNRSSVAFVARDNEERKETFPMTALQQILRNAVMHRTYDGTHAPVRVTWYDDRIEIVSPGGPFGLVNAENFAKPGVTDYRNPNLAAALNHLGFVQRFGAGIRIAQREMEKAGLPPVSFEVTTEFVTAKLQTAP